MYRGLSEDQELALAKNLREARERHKWSVTFAAGRLGVPISQLSMWESLKAEKRRVPELAALLKLAIVYECSIDQLLSAVDERYDVMIERRLPLDAARHYQAKINALIQHQIASTQLVVAGLAPAPIPTQTSGTKVSTSGKSSKVRARRARGK